MTPFEICTLLILAVLVIAIITIGTSKDGFTISYKKTITTINKMDEMQLEIAKQNLAELKKYNENASKQTAETSQAIKTMTTAVQDLMGVNDETR